MKRVVTTYRLATEKAVRPLRAALICDLHGAAFEDILPHLHGLDAVFVGGDLVHGRQREVEPGLAFLREAAQIAPVYYATGNHENYMSEAAYGPYLQKAQEAGATLLLNAYARRGDYLIAGVTETPSFPMLRRLEREDGYKILLCHRPEAYARCAKGRAIDLTLSGHAHGGQIRLFGHGLYAPGQGVLPALTGGLYDGGRLLVSRGLTNTVWYAPRIGNPCELVIVEIAPRDRLAQG